MGAPQRVDSESLFYAGLGVLANVEGPVFEELVDLGRRLDESLGDAAEGSGQPGEASRPYGPIVSPTLEVAEAGPAATAAPGFPPAPVVPQRLRELLPSLLRHIASRQGQAGQAETAERMPDMIEAMMPAAVPTAPAVLQARRNSAARTALIQEHGLLTSTEVAEINQSQAENRAALASRWKGEGRIFSVTHRGRDYFPGFQFGPDGKPREVVARALEAMGGAHGWETALWFTAGNGYLDGQRPVDLLEGDPDAVVEAARHEGEEVYF